MPKCTCATRNLSGGEGGGMVGDRFVELGHFSINISSKTQEKEVPQGNILVFFLLDTLKTTS